MTLNENIERVRELLAERDAIDALLGELIVGASAPAAKSVEAGAPATVPVPAREPARTRRQVTCSKCGVAGHNAKTCPGPSAPSRRKADDDGQDEALSEDQFDELKHLQEIGDLSSREFADDNDVPLAQVNRAISCRNYEDYLNF